MAQTVAVEVFPYDELSMSAQEKVYAQWAAGQVEFLIFDDGFWYVEDYIRDSMLDPYGVYMNEVKLNYAVGQYNGTDGANFTGRVNMIDWMGKYFADNPEKYSFLYENVLKEMDPCVSINHSSFVRNLASTTPELDFESYEVDMFIDDNIEDEEDAERLKELWELFCEDFEAWYQDTCSLMYVRYRDEYEGAQDMENMIELFSEEGALFFEDGTRYYD